MLVRCFFLWCVTFSIMVAKSPPVKPGIEVLKKRGFDLLLGKRVGLITNSTGVTSDLQSTIDILFRAPNVKLVALFSPEHGVRGDVGAGKEVNSDVDYGTGVPIYSLYGRTRKPTPEMLDSIDVLVYDIQDIGVRSYTYISTMGLAMEAAAERSIPFIVLDRPNPLTGIRVEGPLLTPMFKSFIGAYPIPYVYGMTVGELALMINGEGWLGNGVKCSLTVVQMEGWKRTMWWEDTGLPWVPTSPHIPHSFTPLYYVMTGLLGELGTANQGVGYTLPFELVGAPWINGTVLANYLNSMQIEGVRFRPISYIPFYMDTTGIRYRGVQIHVVEKEKLSLTRVQLAILKALLILFPSYNIFERAKPEKLLAFDKAVGNDFVRQALQSGVPVDDILHHIELQIRNFQKIRQKYLLYN
ncbi:MAG: DUF1343 domain-containing protein [Bacteroidetes bacterium]|nr:DUF1343 domain-containing protein [Bacteroidota bacterium]